MHFARFGIMDAYLGRAMNKRRKLVIALSAGALTAPFCSFAEQSGKIPHIGYLTFAADIRQAPAEAFRLGLRELGYVEGRNIIIENRFGKRQEARTAALAAELVNLKVDVIIAPDPPALRAAMNATKTIPIVMRSSTDPVKEGIVASLARPGGNITGVFSLYSELNGKRLELLKETVPAISRVAVFLDPRDREAKFQLGIVQSAARLLSLIVLPQEVRRPGDFESAFEAAAREHANGLLVLRSPIMVGNAALIANLAAKAKLPAIYDDVGYSEAGGLMSYGADLPDLYRRLATYVDKILKGTKPRDLPIEQPTKLELIVNPNAAKALGIEIPNSILVQATKVME